MTIYNAINNASAPGIRNTMLGLFCGNPLFDGSTCADNSFFGVYAGGSILENTNRCTLIGAYAGYTTGSILGNDDCTAIGFGALSSAYSNNNTAVGSLSLNLVQTGFNNIGLGFEAGLAYTGNESSNICIGNVGILGESNTLRLGSPYTGGAGVGEQQSCYIAGIVNDPLTDPTGYDILMIDPTTSETKCISQSDFPNVIITDYSTPGSFTWTKNARTKFVKVYGWSGGCGGGSGSKQLTPSVLGGDGGAPGSVFYMEAPDICFGATEPVVVGAGGTGGAPQTADSTNGNNGTAGGVSSFGSLSPLINATGGGGGGNLLSIQGPWIYINQQLWSVGGDAAVDAGHPASGYGQNEDGDAAESAGIGLAFGMCPTGGGGGCGVDTIAGFTGGAGGSILSMDGLSTLRAGGAGGFRAPGGNGLDGMTSASSGAITGGTGGGGGGPNTVGGPSLGYPGGVGGFPGGGGGGGSGGIDADFDSGAGGTGGGGRILVIEILS